MSRSKAPRLVALVAVALLVGCIAPAADSPTTPTTPLVSAISAPPELDDISTLTPAPEDAGDDIPARPECQMASWTANAPPVVCEFGDPDSDTVVMLVGDSKMVQWRPAFEVLAEQNGWRLIQITKSACAFTDAMTVYKGREWTDCRQWGQAVLDMILEEQPDLVITSHRRPTAIVGDDPGEVTPEAMVDGLVSYWSQLVDAGIETAVLLDNPGPRDFEVPECLMEHPDNFSACTFDVGAGLAASATPVQLAAAEQVPDVRVLDLNADVCPEVECEPTVDGVLIFRQGTHITATFAEAMAPRVAALLD